MSAIDHRAEAERKLAAVDDDSIAPLLEALVHATLAAAKPPAPAPRPQVDSGLRDLLSAARVVLAHARRLGPDDMAVPHPAINALRDQVDEATEAGL